MIWAAVISGIMKDALWVGKNKKNEKCYTLRQSGREGVKRFSIYHCRRLSLWSCSRQKPCFWNIDWLALTPILLWIVSMSCREYVEGHRESCVTATGFGVPYRPMYIISHILCSWPFGKPNSSAVVKNWNHGRSLRILWENSPGKNYGPAGYQNCGLTAGCWVMSNVHN